MVIVREKRINILVSEHEWEMLQALADSRGITASDWVRQQIREAFDGMPAKTPTKSKKKR